MFSFPHSLLEFPCNEYLSVELDAFRVEICSLSVNARSFEDYGYSIYDDFSKWIEKAISSFKRIPSQWLFFEYNNSMKRLA